jgi:AraC family transcriptional regulator of adaptative response / DNA-3-methyladenine glycosylase II
VIGPLIAERPGLRVPGAWGGFEIAVEAVLSQYGARPRVREQLAALVEAAGRPVPGLDDGLTHLFPAARTLASVDLVAAGLPATTARTMSGLAGAAADDETLLDGGAGLASLTGRLAALPGIGLSTAHQIALRLGYGDAFPVAEPAVRTSLSALSAAADAGGEVDGEVTARWRPWRAFVATHLISAGAPTLTA